MGNIIMHVDMDAFFASIEQRDNPKLKGKPVIVGGIGERGVVSTCSYEARKYGVHSAMPIYLAKQKCPFGVYLPVRYKRYKQVSSEIFQIIHEITDLVEPLSIDEAYIDISNVNIEPLRVAKILKKRIKEKTGLTISIGISYNKFLAKLGSDWNKPDGIKVITKEMIPDILMPLNIDKIYGIGKKSVQKLNNIGIFTIKDLYQLPKEYYKTYFGKMGIEIYDRIRGIDNRKVITSREIKSIGKETTLSKDTKNKTVIKEYIKRFSSQISKSLNKKNLSAKTVTVKIKTSNFKQHTKSKTLNEYVYDEMQLYNIAVDILDNVNLYYPIRLIGLSVSNLKDCSVKQLSFNDIKYKK